MSLSLRLSCRTPTSVLAGEGLHWLYSLNWLFDFFTCVSLFLALNDSFPDGLNSSHTSCVMRIMISSVCLENTHRCLFKSAYKVETSRLQY